MSPSIDQIQVVIDIMNLYSITLDNIKERMNIKVNDPKKKLFQSLNQGSSGKKWADYDDDDSETYASDNDNKVNPLKNAITSKELECQNELYERLDTINKEITNKVQTSAIKLVSESCCQTEIDMDEINRLISLDNKRKPTKSISIQTDPIVVELPVEPVQPMVEDIVEPEVQPIAEPNEEIEEDNNLPGHFDGEKASVGNG